MQSNPVYRNSRAGLSLQTCCYDSKSRMSFEEPTESRSSEIDNNQIQITELAAYEERTPVLRRLLLLFVSTCCAT